jgi:2-phospho-L-lactate transferase/gluconeogenesis factor (CofD/UPF0052 family)
LIKKDSKNVIFGRFWIQKHSFMVKKLLFNKLIKAKQIAEAVKGILGK